MTSDKTQTAKVAQPFSDGAFSMLMPELQLALFHKGYRIPTPIQSQTIAPLLDGRDMIGSAQTGTGKTAAFVLPILQRLALQKKGSLRTKPRVLILAPTRELAAQIGESIGVYGKHLRISHTVIFGGIKQGNQVKSLSSGVHIAVATPGRLLDLLRQNHLSLAAVETFVLDEADRMLDMGFLPDIRKIVEKLPQERHTLFFSATLAPQIRELAKSLVNNPVEVSVEPQKTAVEEIVQSLRFVDKADKIKLLVELLSDTKLSKVLVFTQMKHVADRVCDKLIAAGIASEAIHGDKAQNTRTKALDSFKRRRVRVLVATDIAARGIDVDRISHVINYDLPNEPETYVHRIGRTARAGAGGDAISFCSSEERAYLRSIERLIGTKIPVVLDHPFHSERARMASAAKAPSNSKKTSSRSGAAHRSRERLSKPIDYSNGKKSRRQHPFIMGGARAHRGQRGKSAPGAE